MELNGVVKTDKFAQDGDTYYILTIEMVMRANVPSNLIRKTSAKSK